MSTNPDRVGRLAVPPDEDPANAELWIFNLFIERNRCHDCEKPGHRAFSADCEMEKVRRDHIEHKLKFQHVEQEIAVDALAERKFEELVMEK
ncbi:hypothetical protein N7493_007278 [Penicillium malachiteum]|uniref:Uncharacterized protein n=1 Tax=Penicillium malachiteum TaxID=1324776 RepID=A0AAD6HIW8_9EURO|nr:hypothetical protein N7493_007278 [Penicillium malachiteum]